jgi:hypothetical protein
MPPRQSVEKFGFSETFSQYQMQIMISNSFDEQLALNFSVN